MKKILIIIIMLALAIPALAQEHRQSAAKEHLKHYTNDMRAQFQEQADLIFEGTIIDVSLFKGDTVNALEGDLSEYNSIDEALDDLDLRWLVAFKVDRITKGEFLKDRYEILIHSPVDSFGFHIGNPEKGIDRDKYGAERYRIYIGRFPIATSMIVAEILEN